MSTNFTNGIALNKGLLEGVSTQINSSNPDREKANRLIINLLVFLVFGICTTFTQHPPWMPRLIPRLPSGFVTHLVSVSNAVVPKSANRLSP